MIGNSSEHILLPERFSFTFLCCIFHEPRNRGCKCPPEFYGPHCEFLKFSDTDEDSQTNLHESIMENPSRSPYVILVLTLMCVSMVMMVGLVRYKLNAKRVPREITVEGGVVWGDFYTDPRFNGRHRPFCESQNLHVSPVLEDVDLS